MDFLTDRRAHWMVANNTVLMNPPFSKAVEFVETALRLNARKFIGLQRRAWWEGGRRAAFWAACPPNRVYVCADRATCWRVDISPETREAKGNTPTAHAWFVWERGHPPGTMLGRLSKRKDRS